MGGVPGALSPFFFSNPNATGPCSHLSRRPKSIGSFVVMNHETQDNTVAASTSQGDNSRVETICAAAAADDEGAALLAMRGEDGKIVDVEKPCLRFGSATALHVALQNGRERNVKILLDAGASLCAKDVNGASPLMVAASQCSVDIVKLLVESGARIDDEDVEGFTPLHEASNMGKFRVVSYLLSKGASVAARAKDPKTRATPLDLAATGGAAVGRVDLYKILGLEFDATSSEIKKAYRSMALKYHPDKNSSEEAVAAMDRLQRAYDVLSDVASREWYDCGYLNTVDLLLKADSPDPRRSLHIALQFRQWSIAAQIQIACGDGIDRAHRHGRTLLHFAVTFFDTASAKVLLRLGANCDAADVSGETPRQIATNNNDSKTMSLFSGIEKKGCAPVPPLSTNATRASS